jgi:hypothetical protein
MRESIRVSPCILILTIIFAGPAFAQGYRATIVGNVTDPSGDALSNAKVTATNKETGLSSSTYTDDEGDYVIPLIVPGGYRLRVEATGFKGVVSEDVVLQVDQTLRLDHTLEVGQVTEQVPVTAEGEDGIVNTETASLGEVVTNREIVDLPLNGRNYLSLALLAPGVVPAAAGANPHNINGARPDHVNYLLDGISNIDRRGNQAVVTPSIDAIREFKIITNMFSAEYGRLDAGVISVALASGTNSFHGTLFEFHRNDALDARGFFDEDAPGLIRNQFGGVLGGPVVSDRTFFLLSYEGLRNREAQTRLARVPTLEERQGIFAAPIRNPFTRRPFANNTIPSDLISPVARNILAFIPEPNREGALNFITSGVVEEDRDAFIAKIDHQIGGSDHISGRFLSNDLRASVPFRSTPIPGFGSTRDPKVQHWSSSYIHTFSPALINEARFGYVRSSFSELSVNAGKDTSAEAGVAGVARGSGLASLVIAGLPEIGDPTFLPDEWTDNEGSAETFNARNTSTSSHHSREAS